MQIQGAAGPDTRSRHFHALWLADVASSAAGLAWAGLVGTLFTAVTERGGADQGVERAAKGNDLRAIIWSLSSCQVGIGTVGMSATLKSHSSVGPVLQRAQST